MKITTFDPIIVCTKATDAISVFEDLGFEKTHSPVVETKTVGEVNCVRMKHPGGYHIDIADVTSIPADKTYIRMNVDDFEAAYDILVKHGFKNTREDGSTLDTNNSTEVTMEAPSGFKIALVKHIK